jgi:hypothetical protein
MTRIVLLKQVGTGPPWTENACFFTLSHRCFTYLEVTESVLMGFRMVFGLFALFVRLCVKRMRILWATERRVREV